MEQPMISRFFFGHQSVSRSPISQKPSSTAKLTTAETTVWQLKVEMGICFCLCFLRSLILKMPKLSFRVILRFLILWVKFVRACPEFLRHPEAQVRHSQAVSRRKAVFFWSIGEAWRSCMICSKLTLFWGGKPIFCRSCNSVGAGIPPESLQKFQ